MDDNSKKSAPKTETFFDYDENLDKFLASLDNFETTPMTPTAANLDRFENLDEITSQDEEFLLKHLSDGLDLHSNLEKLLYPR